MSGGSDDRRYVAPRFLVVASEFSWRTLVVAAAVALVGFVVVHLRIVVIPLGVALLLAGLLAPPVSWLKERGLPPLLATWAVFLVAGGAVVALLWFVSARIAQQLSELGNAVSEGWRRLLDAVRTSPLGGLVPEDPLSAITSRLGGGGGEVTSRLVSGAATALEVFSMVVLTVIFTFFFLKDGDRLFGVFLGQFRRGARDDAERAGASVWGTSSRYFRGIALIATANALMKGLALVLIGVPLVVVIMLVTFVGSFIPFLGPVIAAVVGAFVALTSGGFVDAALVLLAGFVIQQVEGNVLEPIVMSRVMRIHPIVVIAAVAAGAAVAGIIGAFFAVPIVAVATAVYSRFRTDGEASRG